MTMLRRGMILAVMVLAGCAGGGGDDRDGGRGGQGCRCEPPGCPTISFANNVQPIFNVSCAQSAGCHAGGAPPQDLNLSAGQSYGETVNVRSTQLRSRLLVRPGNPDDSYLIQKIEYPPGTPGVPMPQGCPGNPIQGAVCLTGDDIAALRQWITECAPNN